MPDIFEQLKALDEEEVIEKTEEKVEETEADVVEEVKADEVKEPDADAKPEAKQANEGYEQRRLTKLERENDELRELLKRTIPEQKADVAPQKPALPNPDEDPDAYRDAVLAQNIEMIKELRGEVTRVKTQSLMVQAKDALREIEVEFSAKTPDYADVIKHGMEREARKVKFENPNMPDAEVRATLENRKIMFAVECAKNGRDPAEALYGYMKSVYDYAPKATETQQSRNEVEKMRTVDALKKRTTSPVNGGGARPGKNVFSKEGFMDMKPRDLMNMSQREADSLYDSLN